ncbi:MAG: threonine--tRNA ligase [Alphaproteobacteria bacterium]
MPNISLPDGKVLEFDGVTSGAEIAASIGPGLAKVALAIQIDDQVLDLSAPIENDCDVSLITRGRGTPEALEILRHDCAHVLAEAVQALYPDTKVSIGPSIENGFYYDFYRDSPFSPDDFAAIEAKMHEIVASAAPFVRQEVSREDAIKLFEGKGEQFKVELVSDLPEGEAITLYTQGDWVDLCRGPHAPTTSSVGKYFKLMTVNSAYWRGDHKRESMQRIYGTCWEDKKQLNAYLTMLEEAAKRDHRKLGKEMNLFHMQEEATGSIFWHEKGWTIYRLVEQYMRMRLEGAEYKEVKTPQMVDRRLWEMSGHWDKFRDAMFTSNDDDSERVLALKPMNCPCHVQIFNQGIKSYRDLPLRMAEFGSCHRNEPSGALHGIMRVRAFTQDDAHIFCTEEQINEECVEFCGLLQSIYKDFGFDDILVKFSDRPETRAGTDETWDKAESALKEAIETTGLKYEMNPGEGAFYGPKLEFVLKDAIGRDWQCGTFQVDFVLPDRLNAEYVAADGSRQMPVMLHRAILGSFERFIGILIENHAGRMPLWLSPVQVVVAPITSDLDDYAEEVAAKAKAMGLRVQTDLRNEKINRKVREHSLAKTPVIFVVGKKERDENTVAIRRLGGETQQVVGLDQALSDLTAEGAMPSSS